MTLTSQEIRKGFFDFFETRGHTFVESSPVVPRGDTTLLFTNAGMNQFKDVFLGLGKRAYTRCHNSQKCMRVSGKHNDLDAVGRDTYHHTFFEMLGNWSFGDYYKKEAITWAWELLTGIWKLPKDKLYATVYKDDDDAAGLWADLTDVSRDHILRFGDKENFWEMGDTGPCGPCSEIHIDLGPSRCDKAGTEHRCQVNGDCGRYIELWNLVFIQYNREADGSLVELPAKHVDTGAGFERIVSVLQGAPSNYATDIFVPVINRIADLSGRPYPGETLEGMPHRVIADHIRALSFTIADGALPGNEGRGYVMRRLLRRAARFGLKLGIRGPFMYRLVETLIGIMGETFPELASRRSHIEHVLRSEEEKFARTLGTGLELLDGVISSLLTHESAASGRPAASGTVIPGDEAFKLYDTYGFPYELTEEIAEERGLKVDRAGFVEMMESQRNRARDAMKKGAYEGAAYLEGIEETGPSSLFVGYEQDAVDSTVLGIWSAGARVPSAETGATCQVLLSQVPFYAESGGQVGDRGTLEGPGGLKASVVNTVKVSGVSVATVKVDSGTLLEGGEVTAAVSLSERRATERNHTATHLLHAALRRIVGDHVTQAGSLVEPGRLRFDFTHFDRVTPEQLAAVEDEVCGRVLEDIPVNTQNMSFDDAVARGAMALFEEKYGDTVRVVEVPGFSRELCGGTHVRRTGEIGPFKVVSESSVAQGVRRIEALTGMGAIETLSGYQRTIEELAAVLSAQPQGLVEAVERLREALKEAERENARLREGKLLSEVDGLLDRAVDSPSGFKIVPALVSGIDMAGLRTLADRLLEKIGDGVVLAGSDHEGKACLVAKVAKPLTGRVKAGDIVRVMAVECGGGGGGRPDMAQAGGKDPAKLQSAMDKGVALALEGLA